MTRRPLLLVGALALAAIALPAAAQRPTDPEAIRAAIEAERQALIALGELDPNAAGEADGCDRGCLDGVNRAFLRSLRDGDFSGMTLTRSVRVTENGRVIAPGDGYWGRGGALLQHRLNILDQDREVAAGLAVMDNALLAWRIRAEDGVVSEAELFVIDTQTAGEPETLQPDMQTLLEPRRDFLRRVNPAEQNSHTELLRIAQTYPDGLRLGDFTASDAPFAEGAERMENGVILAGPRCTRNDACLDMKTQPSPTRPTLRQRLLAVDEDQGIVFMWLDWTQQSGKTLQVYEAFKIYAGQIHGVEAFIQHGDSEIYPGWPLDAAN